MILTSDSIKQVVLLERTWEEGMEAERKKAQYLELVKVCRDGGWSESL